MKRLICPRYRRPPPPPLSQLSPPYSITAAPLAFGQWAWVDIDVSGAGWPALVAGTLYWVALLPGRTSSLLASGSEHDGFTWGGYSDLDACVAGLVGALPPAVFTARELTTERAYRDTAYSCLQPQAVNFLLFTPGWVGVPNATVRYTDWTASHVRYGLELAGWAVPASLSASTSREGGGARESPCVAPAL